MQPKGCDRQNSYPSCHPVFVGGYVQVSNLWTPIFQMLVSNSRTPIASPLCLYQPSIPHQIACWIHKLRKVRVSVLSTTPFQVHPNSNFLHPCFINSQIIPIHCNTLKRIANTLLSPKNGVPSVGVWTGGTYNPSFLPPGLNMSCRCSQPRPFQMLVIPGPVTVHQRPWQFALVLISLLLFESSPEKPEILKFFQVIA